MASALLAGLGGLASPALAFGFEEVAAIARDRAARPYDAPAEPPEVRALAALTYDEFRQLRFRPERAWGRAEGSPFQWQFFHAGRGHRQVLDLHALRDGRPEPLRIPRSDFDDPQGRLSGPAPSTRNAARNVAGNASAAAPAAIAGFRIHHALNRPDVMDEVIAFLGASYFRAVGAGQQYGLSARGVAVDTVGGGAEEFPSFQAFWFEPAAPGAQEVAFLALLDGPRVSGAYRFVVRPGVQTVVDVRTRLYLRAPVTMLGLAPLTSMYLFGENQPRADDFRPEVHDSDGLQIAAAEGEWIWRPLVNPPGVFVTRFAMRAPRGFGLMQRDRRFERYEDLEARYERRPSAWVEPLPGPGGAPDAVWASGGVVLLQFHTPDETHDNVGAFWVPDRLPPPGEPIDAAWRIHWQGDAPTRPPGAYTVQSRRGVGYREGQLRAGHDQFHIDFDGPALRSATTGPGAEAVQAVATASDPAVKVQARAQPNPPGGGWRVTLDLEGLDTGRPVELRVFLRRGPDVLTETWAAALPALPPSRRAPDARP